MNDIHIPSPCRLNHTQCNFQWLFKSRVTPDSYHLTLSLRDNHVRVFSFRVTPDSYHSTLSLRDNLVRVFSSRATQLFGLHFEPLTFPDSNYESSLDVVLKTTQPTLTKTVNDHTVHPHPTRHDVTVHANAIYPYCDTKSWGPP